MSLASACLGTLARTLVICLVAWPACATVECWLRSLSDRARSVALIGLLAPFCFPELLVGYAFRDLALFHPRWAELLCSGLLFVRVVPVGAVALLMAPLSECDAVAIHCRRMLVRDRRRSSREWFELAMCYWHGSISRTLPALGLMAVVTFQEFELAALLMTTSWTDWFVAAERVGLERGEMLRQSAWPLLMQLPVLVGVVGWLGYVGGTPRSSVSRVDGRTDEASILREKRRISVWFALAYVVTALITGCVAPLSLIGWRTVDGLSLLARQRTQQLGLLREMAVSLAVAVCAGLAAWSICRGMGLTSPTRERGLLGHFTRSPRSRVGLALRCVLTRRPRFWRRFGLSFVVGDLADATRVAASFKRSRQPQFDHARCETISQQIGRQTQDVRVVVPSAHLGRQVVVAERGTNAPELVRDDAHADA